MASLPPPRRTPRWGIGGLALLLVPCLVILVLRTESSLRIWMNVLDAAVAIPSGELDRFHRIINVVVCALLLCAVVSYINSPPTSSIYPSIYLHQSNPSGFNSPQ